MSDLIDRLYEVAYFFKMSPLEVYALTLDEFIELKTQSDRIAEMIQSEKDV